MLEGYEIELETEQALTVKYYMTDAGYKNAELRTSLTATAIEVINNAFASPSVVVKDIASKIQSAAGDDVITVSVQGLGGGVPGYDIVTLTNQSARLGVKKKLLSLADGSYTVEDDVDVLFLKHRES
ncbi:hypothetical protein D3C84_947620 [compost metagenome]